MMDRMKKKVPFLSLSLTRGCWNPLHSVLDDEKSLSTVFRVQYFFLVFYALLSFFFSLRAYNPHSTIAQPNWYRPGLSHPSPAQKRKGSKGTIGPARTANPAKETLSPTVFKIEIIHHERAGSFLFNISLSCTSFIQTRIHDFLGGNYTSHFYLQRRTHANTGPRLMTRVNFPSLRHVAPKGTMKVTLFSNDNKRNFWFSMCVTYRAHLFVWKS